MAIVLLIIGVVMVTAAVRNTTDVLGTLLKEDFTGQNNFIYWLVAILIIGGVGYIPTLKGISNVFLILLIVVLFLTKGRPGLPGAGFFEQFNKALGLTQLQTQQQNVTQQIQPTQIPNINFNTGAA